MAEKLAVKLSKVPSIMTYVKKPDKPSDRRQSPPFLERVTSAYVTGSAQEEPDLVRQGKGGYRSRLGSISHESVHIASWAASQQSRQLVSGPELSTKGSSVKQLLGGKDSTQGSGLAGKDSKQGPGVGGGQGGKSGLGALSEMEDRQSSRLRPGRSPVLTSSSPAVTNGAGDSKSERQERVAIR